MNSNLDLKSYINDIIANNLIITDIFIYLYIYNVIEIFCCDVHVKKNSMINKNSKSIIFNIS